MSWAFQGLRPGGKGTTPLGTRSAKLPLVERPPLSPVQSSDLSLPPVGSQHPSSGILAPWRSELIISPCVPHGPVHRVWS
jgi:hypothetical protein